MTSRSLHLLVQTALLLVVPLSGALAAQERPEPARRPHILLVTVEAFRADRLGCYGRAGSITPDIDRLAAEGLCFERAYTPAPVLLPASASILTGLAPLAHGLHEDGRLALAEELPTLAERLRAQGYRTAAFVGSARLSRDFGLTRGFEHYDDQMGGMEDIKAFARERRARFVVGSFLEWLSQREEQVPVFAWLHLPDPSYPYAPPPDLRSVGDSYDGELAAVDREIGRLLGSLEQQGLLGRTVIALAGSMGEALGEEGELTHGLGLQEAVIRVPLILRPAEGAGSRRVRTPVGLADLMPTLMELAGAAAPLFSAELTPFAGQSLASLLAEGAGEPAARDLLVENETGARLFGWSPLRALVRGEHQLIEGSLARLFRIDPESGKRLPVLEGSEALARSMQDELAARVELAAAIGKRGRAVRGPLIEQLSVLLPELPDALRGGPLPGRGAPDPLARVEAWNSYREALETAWAGNSHLISDPLVQAAVASPDTALMQLLAGIALERIGRFGEARTYLELALELDPGLGVAHHYLGRCHTSLGNPGEAENHYLLALEIDPGDELSLRTMGRRMAESGRLEEARPYFEALAELRPEDSMVWGALIHIDRTRSDWAGLAATLAAAASHHPADLYYRNFQAWVLATAPVAAVRDPARAIAIAQQLVQETQQKDPGILDTLAAALASAGRFPEAEEQVQKAIGLASNRKLDDFVKELRSRLALYQRQRPYFER